MRNFAWTLRRHEENVLNYFRMALTNARVEGLNNKAKVISRRSYGLRSARNYMLHLYHGMAGSELPHMTHTFA